MHKISAHHQLVHISQRKHITKRPTAFLRCCKDATWEILSPRLPAHARVCSHGLLVVFASTAGKGLRARNLLLLVTNQLKGAGIPRPDTRLLQG